MSKIHLLNDTIANKIAAGEVIERPASIIKELVENSIDAGSTKIDILIKESGLDYIIVKDNGEGILKEDIEKAFLRHATSKIKDEKDLFKIRTLGFRGEALPSIAVISKLILKTSTNNDGNGTEIYIEGGEIKNKSEIAFTRGTEISVKNIFYNTPVRLKYLKSMQTELSHIIDYVNKLSLAHTDISFTLIHNERIILSTYGNNNLIHVISTIYSASIAKKMIPINIENIDFKITGAISKPEITRTNRNHIIIFVNKRYIKNYLLTQAVIKGYKNLLMVNRYPISVLNIDMDPTILDVNVHPAKLEAKFSKEKEMNKLVEEVIYKALTEHTLIPEPLKKIVDLKYTNSLQTSFDLTLKPDKDNSSFIFEKNDIEIKQSNKLPFLEPIAQFHGTYIIAQSIEGIYLIDQHAAHERVNYEKNIRLINLEKIEYQDLTVPITLNYSKSEIEHIFYKIEELKRVGIEIELFGKQSIIIRSIPIWIPKGQEIYFIEKALQEILSNKEINMIDMNKDLVAAESCKSSIKANRYLTKNEMEELLEQLRRTENPYTCPHGRPVIVYFSKYDIEKMFKRVT
ncbi:MAG: DNA mismatch repair endonuclease MutL [Vulcanibacillus sp.]